MTENTPHQGSPIASSSRARLENILDGRAGGGGPVAEIVDAARRPAEQSELGGLDAALTAFRSSQAEAASGEHTYPASTHRRGLPVIRRLAAATLATKLVVGSFAAAATGYATFTTVEHYRHQQPHPTTSTGPATPGSPAPASTSGQRTGSSPSPNSATPTASSSQAPTAETSTAPGGAPSTTSLVVLCAQWHAESPASRISHRVIFAPLVTAAGGASNVDAFCATLSGKPSGSSANTTGHTSTSSTPTRSASTARSSPTSSAGG